MARSWNRCNMILFFGCLWGAWWQHYKQAEDGIESTEWNQSKVARISPRERNGGINERSHKEKFWSLSWHRWTSCQKKRPISVLSSYGWSSNCLKARTPPNIRKPPSPSCYAWHKYPQGVQSPCTGNTNYVLYYRLYTSVVQNPKTYNNKPANYFPKIKVCKYTEQKFTNNLMSGL